MNAAAALYDLISFFSLFGTLATKKGFGAGNCPFIAFVPGAVTTSDDRRDGPVGRAVINNPFVSTVGVSLQVCDPWNFNCSGRTSS